jgi:hypothetical protein
MFLPRFERSASRLQVRRSVTARAILLVPSGLHAEENKGYGRLFRIFDVYQFDISENI